MTAFQYAIGDTLVSLHLLGLRPAQNLHGGDAAGYVWFRARYLVTARAADVHAANELLERLFVAASISDGIEPRLDVLGADTWLALQTRPRPAFVVDLACSGGLVPWAREQLGAGAT